MKLSSKQIKIFVIIIGIALIMYLVSKYMKRTRTRKGVQSTDTVGSITGSLGICKFNSDSFPLKKCSSGGEKTRKFQELANGVFSMYEGVPLLKVDGKFGPNTEKAALALLGSKEVTAVMFTLLSGSSANKDSAKSHEASIKAKYGSSVSFIADANEEDVSINTSLDNDFYNPNLYGDNTFVAESTGTSNFQF